MVIYKKHRKAALLCACLMAIICIAAILAGPTKAAMNTDSAKSLSGSWLTQYEGKNIRITFVSPPTHLRNDFRKTTDMRLFKVEQTGIVVTFRPERTVFFPYEQIASIEPIY